MAAITYKVHLDLDSNELQNAVLQPLTGAPTGVEGRLYYDSTAGDKRGYIYDGTAWTPFGWANKAYGQITLGTTTNPGDTWSLNATSITGQTELLSGLLDTDEMVISDGGVLKRIDLSVLKTYINAAAGTFSSFDIAGDTGTDTITDAETVTFTGGTGIVTAVTTGVVTYSLDFSELTDKITAIAGTTEFILQDGVTESRKAASEIGLQFFDNSVSAFSTTVGTVTSVGISGAEFSIGSSPITTSGTITLALATAGVANSKLATMAANTVKANATPGVASPTDVSIAANQVLGRLAGNIVGISIIDDDTMAAATASNLATSESIVAYVNSQIIGGMKYKGAFDPTAGAGAGSPDLDTITSEIGDTYTVTVAGTYTFTTGSAVLEIGDMLIAEADGVLNDVASWTIVNRNIENTIDSYFTLIGNGVLTTFTVTHNLNNVDATVRVIDDTSKAQILCDTRNTSANTVTVNVNTAPTSNQYRVIVQG